MPEWITSNLDIIITAVVAPAVMLILQKIFSKRHDETSLADEALAVAKKAFVDLKEEKVEAELREQKLLKLIQELKTRIQVLEGMESGPYGLYAEFTTMPLKIQRVEIRQVDKQIGSTPFSQ